MFRRMFGGGGGGAGGSTSSSSAGSPAPKTTSVLDAVGSIDQTIENLEKRVELLQKKIDAENAIIKQLMSSPTEPNKKKAMQCLKKRKLYEKEHENAELQIFALTEKREALASLKETAELVRASNVAAATMKQLEKEINIDKVDKVADELGEGFDQMIQIQERLTQPMGYAKDLDESELMDELNALTVEAEIDEHVSLPTVPSTRVQVPQAAQAAAPAPVKKTGQMTEEEELMALAAEMA